jgi:hypothetical protein
VAWVVDVEAAVGVPPVHVDAGQMPERRVSAAPDPTSEMFEICEPPLDLWSNDVAVVDPQCAQSSVPVVARLTLDGAVALVRESEPGTFTVNDLLTGDASALFTPSIARTSNVCVPLASAGVVYGEVQVTQVPPSMRHW